MEVLKIKNETPEITAMRDELGNLLKQYEKGETSYNACVGMGMKLTFKILQEATKIKMTTKEFLDRYDNKKYFTEQELEDLWWDDLFEDYVPKLMREVENGEPSRWQIPQDKVIKIEDRYFMIYRWRAATEYQETEYDWQPDEVYPVEKTIIVWEGAPKNV